MCLANSMKPHQKHNESVAHRTLTQFSAIYLNVSDSSNISTSIVSQNTSALKANFSNAASWF